MNTISLGKFDDESEFFWLNFSDINCRKTNDSILCVRPKSRLKNKLSQSLAASCQSLITASRQLHSIKGS